MGLRTGLDGAESLVPHRDSIPGQCHPWPVGIPTELSRPVLPNGIRGVLTRDAKRGKGAKTTTKPKLWNGECVEPYLHTTPSCPYDLQAQKYLHLQSIAVPGWRDFSATERSCSRFSAT